MATKKPEEITKNLQKIINKINTTVLKVGIPKEETEQDREGKTVFIADIAFENNFGSKSKNIPARPFGSTTIPRYEDKIIRVIKTWLRDALEGRIEVIDAYDRIGFVVAGYMRKNLGQGEWKGNSEITIQKKGSDQPLIDTGQMRQSITWITEEKK